MNKPFYQCAVCNQGFEAIEDLRRHEEEYHNPIADQEVSIESAGGPFPCPECGAVLPSPEVLEEHILRLHPAREGMGEP